MRPRNIAVAIALALAFSNAQSALHDRGGGLIYDDVLKVTWLADANLSMSNTFGVAGIGTHHLDYGSLYGSMSWYVAQEWLAAINRSNYLGYSDWRFPIVKPVNGATFNNQFSTDGSTDVGYNITSVNSELAHLANVDLVGSARSMSPTCPTSMANCAIQDIGLFKNVNQRYSYITATEVYPGSDSYRSFSFDSATSFGSVSYAWGYQGTSGKGYPAVAMVLRDGDVASVAAPIPEPETYAMMLAGLGLLGLTARRRRHNIND